MECSFEEEIDLPGGGYRHAKCIARAMIFETKDPCFGLCYHCAYKQLRAEIKWLKKLANYGRHKEDCNPKPWENECKCGFLKALRKANNV